MAFDKVWEKIFSENEWGKYPPEELIRFVAKHYYSVNDRSKIKFLETGCGPGANMWYLAREKFSIYGIDGSSSAIANCNSRLNKEVPNWEGNIAVGDIISLPYDNDYFDAFIDIECLSCNTLQNSKLVLNEVFRTLKKGSFIFSKSFSVDSWGYNTGRKVEKNTFFCSDGPTKEKGLCRFMTEKDIYELYGNLFKNILIDKVSRTTNNMENTIIEWIIQAEK